MGASTPISRLCRDDRLRAASSGTNASAAMAVRTRAPSTGLTAAGALMARETVAVDTPARTATSRNVARVSSPALRRPPKPAFPQAHDA